MTGQLHMHPVRYWVERRGCGTAAFTVVGVYAYDGTRWVVGMSKMGRSQGAELDAAAAWASASSWPHSHVIEARP